MYSTCLRFNLMSWAPSTTLYPFLCGSLAIHIFTVLLFASHVALEQVSLNLLSFFLLFVGSLWFPRFFFSCCCFLRSCFFSFFSSSFSSFPSFFSSFLPFFFFFPFFFGLFGLSFFDSSIFFFNPPI